MKHKLITIQYYILAALSFFLLYLLVFSLIPFSWYVDIDSYSPKNVCTGSVIVLFESTRTPRWGIKGKTYSQVVRFVEDDFIETTITRGSVSEPVSFGYEPNTYSVSYETLYFDSNGHVHIWDAEGEYGVQEWITIYPLPFISLSRFNPAESTRFMVKNCNFPAPNML